MRISIPILLLMVLSTFFSIETFAQGLCDKGGGSFTVDNSEGCAPLTVRITNTLADPLSLAYAAAYDGRSTNPAIQNVASVTYRNRGTYTLLQQAVVAGGVVYACKTITVYESRGLAATYSSCGGGKITLILAEDLVITGYDQVLIEWGDGKTDIYKPGDSFIFDHVYADVNSSPTVRITGQHIGKPCEKGAATSIPISFQQAQLGDIAIKSIEMLGGGTLRLNYVGVTAIPTDIQYSTNGGAYVTSGRRSSGGLQPYDIPSVNTNQVYKVKLTYQDLCQGLADSREYSSMTLSGKSENGANILTWNQYPDIQDFVGYDLMRDGTLVKSFTSIADITYTDDEVACGSYSEYRIVAKVGDVTSTSAPVGVKTEVSTARPIQGASVSVAGENLVYIKAEVPGAGPNSTYDLSIEKAEAGSTTFKKIITLYNQSEYSDPDVKTSESSYCYRLNYQNSCGQKLPVSEPMCTILLKKQLTTLVWNPELPMIGAIAGYEVIQIGSGTGNQVVPVQMNTQYTIKLNAQSELEYNFQIRATSASGTFESLSNIINYKRSAGVFVPDAFTPNGDGYNDVLEAKSTQLQSFNLSILNRWGEVVFHSDDIANSWDGTINGTNAPVGSYVYKMTFVDDINQTVEKSGTFMLLR